MINIDSPPLVSDESVEIRPFTLRNVWEARFCQKVWLQTTGQMQTNKTSDVSGKRLVNLAKQMPLWRLIVYVYLGV
jgi:hypothetical protein